MATLVTIATDLGSFPTPELPRDVCYIKVKGRLLVHLNFWHAGDSVVSASIEMGFENCATEDHRVYFYKPTEPIAHQPEYVKVKGVSSQQPMKHLASGSSPTAYVFFHSNIEISLQFK